jgi:hypothetical protein
MKLRDRWAERGHRAANMRLQLLKNVLKRSLIAGEIKRDPFPLIGQVRRPPSLAEPHRIWPDHVLAAVVQAALDEQRPGLARAAVIGRYPGARRGDLVRLTRAARQDGRIRFVTGKRRVAVDMDEGPELAAWLDRLPDRPPDAPRPGRKVVSGAEPTAPFTLIFNVAGNPYSEDGLGQELRKLVNGLHSAGKVDSDKYDLHGLRHTRGVELALAGLYRRSGGGDDGTWQRGKLHAVPSSGRQNSPCGRRHSQADELPRTRSEQKCKTAGGKVENRTFGTNSEPGEISGSSTPCDGTASPDRTEDLQIHNLAL